MDTINEKNIILKAQQKDWQSFEEIVNKYQDRDLLPVPSENKQKPKNWHIACLLNYGKKSVNLNFSLRFLPGYIECLIMYVAII